MSHHAQVSMDNKYLEIFVYLIKHQESFKYTLAKCNIDLRFQQINISIWFLKFLYVTHELYKHPTGKHDIL